MIAIFDLDGTLANIEHRLHFIKHGNSNWDDFFAACTEDTPNWPICSIFENLALNGYRMWIFSGRSDAVREETKKWLKLHAVEPEKLFMRKAGDHQPDDQLKQSWIDNLTKWEKDDILCAFDDRQRLVDMWRKNGITCLQVAEGNF